MASASSASPVSTAVPTPYCAHTDGAPRRSLSSSSPGRSSWTSENECTSSTAAAAGSRLSTRTPIASPVARQRTGRTRLPPSAWRIGPASVPSSGARASSSRYASTCALSWSAGRGIRVGRRCRFRLGGALRALQLRLDLAREVGELLQDLDRLVGVLRLVETRPRLLEPRQQVLSLVQRVVRRHLRSSAGRAGTSAAPSIRLMPPPPVGFVQGCR